MDLLVTYDIDTTDKPGERRLTEVAKTCEEYGQRVQDSVFECRLSETILAALLATLESIIEPARDSVHVYRLSDTFDQARTVLGCSRNLISGTAWIL